MFRLLKPSVHLLILWYAITNKRNQPNNLDGGVIPMFPVFLAAALTLFLGASFIFVAANNN